MPNIRGTNGNDIIDVTDDNGTLNGTPQGTPIDNIRGRGGSDQITVTNSTVIGVVRGNGGGDDITITGSTVGTLNAGGGADTVVVRGSDISSIALGNGNDTLDFQSTSVSGTVEGGGGTDTLNLPEGTVITDSTFGTITVVAGTSYSLSSGSFTLPSGTTVTYTGFENGAGFPCFTRDTLIATDCGFARSRTSRPGTGCRRLAWDPKRCVGQGGGRSQPETLNRIPNYARCASWQALWDRGCRTAICWSRASTGCWFNPKSRSACSERPKFLFRRSS